MKNSIAVLLNLVALVSSVLPQTEDIFSLFQGVMQQERSVMQEPCDDNGEESVFDFIIVGAGAAGCVLANRLTEVENWKVLLLEAGGEQTEIMNVPYSIGKYFGTEVDWGYLSEPSSKLHSALRQNRVYYPSGRVMGGGTVLNYMYYVRGNEYDYNNWEKMGNPGWKFNDILPYFKKVEGMQIPELQNSKYHSSTGNIRISYLSYQSEMSRIILEAGKELGYNILDYNGKNQTGFSRPQTTTSNGSRWSASKGYLYSIRDRRNLHVRKRSLVEKILINPVTKTAYGVRYIKKGTRYTAFVRKEVIICAGSFKSPQLLMLSGIGPMKQLENFHLPVIKDLPVGKNLMDHVMFFGLLFILNKTKAFTPSEILYNPNNYLQYYINNTGPLTTPGPFETLSFLELKNTSYYTPDLPNLEVIYFSRSGIIDNALLRRSTFTDEVYNEYIMPLQGEICFGPLPFLLRPRSKGKISLRDDNIETQPIIDPQFFSATDDLIETVLGIKKIINDVLQTKAFQNIGIKLYDKPLPPCKNILFGSDEYWKCAVKSISSTTFHPCGTCKMGQINDSTSVVDHNLKVHGIHGLRVIDASIIPMIPSGHLQATVYMIAEKGADIIKNDHTATKSP